MNIEDQPILITGAAGFIGSFLSRKLIKENKFVIGVDNLNDYYDINLKKNRLNELVFSQPLAKNNFKFCEISIANQLDLISVFKKYKPKIVVNLAAQAGVRYSITNPNSYINSNLVGFANILEACRNFKIKHLIYASSSSVYGGNTSLPFSEKHPVNHPVSLYAATKKSNELLAHSYSHLYDIPTTGLRFFTVYGPWGRPDMAPLIFANLISKNKQIRVFNYGNMQRDFTYIDDVVKAIFECINKIPIKDLSFDTTNPDPSTSFAASKILNIGNNKPVELLYFIELIEKNLGKKAIKNLEPLQDGDVISTCANISEAEKWINFSPETTIEEGTKKFIDWFKKYYL